MLVSQESFEGTLILEKLAEIDQLGAFYEAIDADDFSTASRLLRRAGIDSETIAVVLCKMANADSDS